MPYVITIAQTKGGAGKTTLACQLAAHFLSQGRTLAGIDMDEQGGFARWGAMRSQRSEENFLGVESQSFLSLSHVNRAPAPCEIVLIDTPPRSDHRVRKAIRAADIVLAPLQLSPLDLYATLPTAKMIGDAGKKALFVINRAPPRAKIADTIRAMLKSYALPVAAIELGGRAAFAETIATGGGVCDLPGRNPARRELQALGDEVAIALKEIRIAA